MAERNGTEDFRPALRVCHGRGQVLVQSPSFRRGVQRPDRAQLDSRRGLSIGPTAVGDLLGWTLSSAAADQGHCSGNYKI